MYCSDDRLSMVCGDRIDGSEPSAWDSIRLMCGVAVDSDSIQKVNSFLFVFVRLRSHYYTKKLNIIVL
jgi:hypothetical protein